MLISRAIGNNEFEFGVVTVDGRIYEPLTVTTFPEKCVWSQDNVVVYCGVPTSIPRELYPDRWYQNEISFSDDLYRIDTSIGSATLVEDFGEVSASIDVIKPQFNEDETFVFFVDKRTDFLWAKDVR
jgi:hypothetical protein